MPGDTNLGANADEHAEQLVVSTNYRCNSCQTSFMDGRDQRTHMKMPWHVHNVKRRIASLPPVSRDEFDAGIAARPIKNQTKTSKTPVISRSTRYVRSKSDEEIDLDSGLDAESQENDTNNEDVSPFLCLFCNHSFAQDDAGFSDNLEHMQTAHGLFIPDPALVSDLQSFVCYLAIEIRAWHECLYCGAMKPSTVSIQSHMRDKRHCLLNFDREPELLDFWERSPSVGGELASPKRPVDPSETELQLSTGKVIGSRHAAPAARKPPKGPELVIATIPQNKENPEIPPLSMGAQLGSTQQLVRREEMSLVGISQQQRQALVLAKKKAQRSETMARKAREWVYSRGSNSQKFDQIDGSGKWGKQNHKLQPR